MAGDFIGGGLSVDAGVSLGFSVGGLEICHDYLVYANNAYIQWVKDMGTFVSHHVAFGLTHPSAVNCAASTVRSEF